MTDIDIMDFNIFGGRAIQNEHGQIVGDLIASKKDNRLLVEPHPGQNWRTAAEMGVAVAQANPSSPVFLDFSAKYFEIAPADTVTNTFIRILDAFNASSTVKSAGEEGGAIKTQVAARDQYSDLELFEVAVDAIRLSRANGGKRVMFEFNGYRLQASGASDAQAIESQVPAALRKIERPRPPQSDYKAPPEKTQKMGPFTVRGG